MKCLFFRIEQVSSLHMTQTQWMLNLLLFVVPDHSEVQDQEQGENHSEDISPQTLDEDAKSLIKKMEHLSSYLSRYRHLLRTLAVLLTQCRVPSSANIYF